MEGALFGSECRNSDFRRGPSGFFCIGLHAAALDGLLLCFGRRDPSGSRDLISTTSCLFGPAESTSRAHSVLRQRHGADRAPARAARNGCAASKTRLTTCEAQTAMASSHRAASWIEGQRSPTDVTWALFQHGRSVEPTRYCLAPVLEGLFRRVYPCLSCRRGIRAPSCTHCAITLAWHIPVIVVRFGRHGAFYLWQVWWSAQAGRKGRHELCSSQPYKPPTNHPARPLMQNFFRCAGQIATPCGARYPSWGEARRKRRQVRTKST